MKIVDGLLDYSKPWVTPDLYQADQAIHRKL